MSHAVNLTKTTVNEIRVLFLAQEMLIIFRPSAREKEMK